MRFVLTVIFSLFPMLVYANIGTIVELTGLVVIKRNKETITATKDVAIMMNDRIESKNGKAKIVFKDKTSVTVTEHSALVIDDFVYDPKSSAGKISMKAAEGTVRYVSGAIAHNDPKSVNIKTPTATIAVRGTDFVMSVNEVGSSMVILMPSCENASCMSGIIDVNTGFGSVTMDKPYQATMVEGNAAPPTPPVIVNLSNSPIGNNLQIAPPATASGANVISAAREAAAKTGDAPATVSVHNQEVQAKQQDNKPAATASTKENKTETTASVSVTSDVIIDTASVSQPETTTQKDIVVDTTQSTQVVSNVKKIWSDTSRSTQIGWLYERLTGNNYTNIKLPLDTRVNVVVNQDRQIDSYNFNLVQGQGTIIINQVYR